MNVAREVDDGVSVIMPIWRADPRALEAALASVLAQTHERFELLVLEDASDRPAEPILARFDDPRIVHDVARTKTSMAAARNRGLARAQHELVAICDGDDVCHPERLARQVEFLCAHPDVSVVGTALRVIDEDGAPRGGRRYPALHDAIVAAMPRINPIAHPSVMFRRSAVLDAGAYDESDERICEDYELWSRLASRGVRFANLSEPLLDYRLHAGASKRTRLRATLRDTLAIKRRYWRSAQGLRGRARMAGEAALLRMPPSFVYWLFQRTTLERW